MNDDELLRYSRHILLPDIDIEGQQAFADARVLVVGLGGLGSPVAMYLGAAGIGHLSLVDFDHVDISNLQRQVIHQQARVGDNKAESAKAALLAVNPLTEIETINHKVDNWDNIIDSMDIVVDCTDNFATRFAINAACYRQKKPLVSAAAIRFEGQLSVFDHRDTQSPCYQCLYSSEGSDDLTCSEAGVIAPIVGVMGSLQALEVLKLIANIGTSLIGRLLLFDAKQHQWREMRLPKDPQCLLCGTHN
jgi:adenylyltransferase/sulfurtransferase